MSSSFQQFNIYPSLTPVRVTATSNQSGVYFNGQLNNGVGATFLYEAGLLIIDDVTVVNGDRVLFVAQTDSAQNGIYVCTTEGTLGNTAVLTRAGDQQNIEQLHEGFIVTVSAGSANAGRAYVLVEPLPGIIGIDGIIWQDSGSAGGGDVILPTVANNFAAFTDTDGTLASLYSPSDSSKTVVPMLDSTPVTSGHLAVFSGTAGTLTESTLNAARLITNPFSTTAIYLASGVTSAPLSGSGAGPYLYEISIFGNPVADVFCQVSTNGNGVGVATAKLTASQELTVNFTGTPSANPTVAWMFLTAP